MKKKNERESGMCAVTGIQGVGKTYLNMYVIKDYIKDKFYNKVRGRKCLIMDTNGEYTRSQFQANDIDTVFPKRLSVKDVGAWCRTPGGELRRIDAKNIGLEDKIKILEYLINNFKNGMLVLEDINTYILSVTHLKEIVGAIVNLRHRAVDVLISYQSARAVEPRIWQNAKWVRMHYQADNVNDIKGKLPNVTMYKLAQILVNNRYFNGDKRFYVYIHNFANKIEGQFTKTEFMTACKQYLSSNKKEIREFEAMYSAKNTKDATNKLAQQYFEMYYGNNQ